MLAPPFRLLGGGHGPGGPPLDPPVKMINTVMIAWVKL